MAVDRSLKVMIGVLVALSSIAAASQASAVLAPLTLALLIIAVVWPVQSWLQSSLPLPPLVTLTLVICATAFFCFLFAALAAWAFTRVARAFVADQRYQTMYDALSTWLEGHDLTISGVWTEYFSAASLLSVVQRIAARLNTMMSLWVVALVYVILGLLEVQDVKRRLLALDNRELAETIRNSVAQTAAKLRRYAAVRTLMSIATGL